MVDTDTDTHGYRYTDTDTDTEIHSKPSRLCAIFAFHAHFIIYFFFCQPNPIQSDLTPPACGARGFCYFR